MKPALTFVVLVLIQIKYLAAAQDIQYGVPLGVPLGPNNLDHENEIVPKKSSGIKFLLYFNPNDTESCHVIDSGSRESLAASAYNSSRPVKFLIHSETADSKTPDDIKVVTDAYVKTCFEANVIMVDYGQFTKTSLPFVQGLNAMLRTNQIAHEIAEFITFLIKSQVLRGVEDVHIVGFGLGAHIGGTVGRTLWRSVGRKVGRVSGLDPLVGVKLPFRRFRLDPSDADFVDVTNTALRRFTFRRRGHVRFYINGGGSQPNCPRFFTRRTGCSHHVAVLAFAKSIEKPNEIVGCRCLSIFCRSRFLNSKSCVDPIPYGECVSKMSRGSYYVTLT